MRLLFLSIDGEYKSIKGNREKPFAYRFENSEGDYSPLCLVGLNGSGKSNFIELIADIFGYADRYYNEQYTCKEDLTYDFQIDYQIKHQGDDREVSLSSKNSRLEMALVGELNRKSVVTADYHELLPARVIAYSSGHNQGLSSVFAKTQLQYFEVIQKQSAFYRGFQQRYELISGRDERSEAQLAEYVRNQYSANPNVFELPPGLEEAEYFAQLDLGEPLTYKQTELPKGFFTDHSFSQLIFVYLLVTKNAAFEKFIAEEIRIGALCSFELDLRLSAFRDFEVVKDIANRLVALSLDSLEFAQSSNRLPFRFNKSTLSGVLSFDLNTNFFESLERLYLDSSVFLEHLITLVQLGAKKWSADEKRSLRTSAYERNVPNVSGGVAPIRFINTRVRLVEPEVETLYDRLSDGEHQLMQVIGSLIMFDLEESLFILDEPESHFNPEWRMEFLALIAKYVNLNNLELIISTHSPFILSACKSDRVLDFRKKHDGEINIGSAGVETYGASFDSLLTSVFGLDVLIAEKPLTEIRQILEVEENSNESAKEILGRLEAFGESFELNYRRNQLRRIIAQQDGCD